METKSKVAIATGALALAFAGGRYMVSPKIVTVEKKVEVTKEIVAKDKKKSTRTVVKILPNGEKTIVRTTKEDTETTKTKDDTSSTENSKVVAAPQDKVTISLLAGKKITDGLDPILFGAHVTKPILGPVTVGVWGLSNLTFGVSVGLQF